MKTAKLLKALAWALLAAICPAWALEELRPKRRAKK
tara:strand:+ start:257 stop:364 length:108 start_codon:yes stop_codon:yes gene_type:complete